MPLHRPDKRQRSALQSSAYMTLARPPAVVPGAKVSSKGKKAAKKFERYRAAWVLASQILKDVDPAFHFTNLAITKNFTGSPHIDKFDVSYQ